MKVSKKFKRNLKKKILKVISCITVVLMLFAGCKLADISEPFEIFKAFDYSMSDSDAVVLSTSSVGTTSTSVDSDGAIVCDSIIQGIRDTNMADGEYTLRVSGTDDETVDYEIELYNYTDDVTYSLDDGATATTKELGSSNADERMLVVKYHKNLTIDKGVKLTAAARKKGMYICVLGDIVNNGTISMQARGAIAEGENVFLWKNADGTFETVPAVGGAGGAGVYRSTVGLSYNAGASGSTISKRATGGGGSGGSATSSTSYKPTSGSGSAGTSYSGGSGGGAASRVTATATSAGANGGAGGSSYTYTSTSYSATGGTGNPGGSGRVNNAVNSAYAGTTGTGGLLIIYSDNIYNNGNINSNGTNANNTQCTTTVNRTATGGASGGGSVNIFCNYYSTSVANSLTAIGGTSTKGGAGGAGSVSLMELGQYLNYTEKEIVVNTGATYTFDLSKFSYIAYEKLESGLYSVGTLKYEIEDASIASITSAGKLVGIKDGNTKVIVTDTSTNIQTQVYVKVVNDRTAKVEVGSNFTTVLKEDGTVWTWGANSSGQLGIDSTIDNIEPIRVGDEIYPEGYSDYIETTVVAEGLSLEKGIGNEIDNRINENDADYLKNIIDISAGSNHVLAVSETGRVYTWGENSNGQLGNGSTDNSQKATMLTLSNIIKVDANLNTSFALSKDGKVYVWGEGYSNVPELVDLSTISEKVIDISKDILLTEKGYVYKFINNGEGYSINKVENLENISKISAGTSHYLALNSAGYVYSWGTNTYGELASNQQIFENLYYVDLKNIYDISAGNNTSMFLTNTGDVYVSGDNTNGKLGITATKATLPTKIESLSNIEYITTGEGSHSAVMDADGWLYLTGLNTNGQLGFKDTTNRTTYTKLGETKIGLNKVLYNDRLFLNYGETEELKAKVINTINLKTDIVSEDVIYSVDDSSIMSLNGNKLNVDNYGEVKLTITSLDGLYTKDVRVVTYLQLHSIVQGVKEFNIPDGSQTIVIVGTDNELVDYDVEMINYYEDMIYTSNTSLGNSEADSRMLILKYHNNLTISKGVTLTATTRKKGMYICTLGKTYNEGTITMTARGANAEGQNVYLWQNDDGTYETVPAIGGAGGAGVKRTSAGLSYNVGSKGSTVGIRATGGGGSGGATTTSTSYVPTSGSGSAGTSYSGGSGGGAVARITGTATSAEANGGAGGNSYSYASTSYSATGGTGNPGGTGRTNNSINSTYAGTTGTGGLLIVYSNELYNKGVISSNGTNANNAQSSTSTNHAVTGGASGGGSVNVFCNAYYKGKEIDLTATGGASSKGGSGGDGTTNILELGKILNYDDKELKLNVSENYNIDVSKLSIISKNTEIVNSISDFSSITFKSENEEIAKVNTSGIITALKLGKTRIIIEDTENKIDTSIYINVINSIEPKVEAGSKFSVVLKENGTVWTWGENTYGQLGIGSTDNNIEPIRVGDKVYPEEYTGYLETTVVAEGLSLEQGIGNEIDNRIEANDDNYLKDICDISVGYNHVLALSKTGKVYSWGANAEGQLGDNTNEIRTEATELGLSNIIEIDANKNTSIALNSNGTVYFWGEMYRNAPVEIDTSYISGKPVSVAGDIILTSTGKVYKIQVVEYTISLQLVDNLSEIVKISAGEGHYLALNAKGEVYGFGANTYGELGNSTNTTGKAIIIENIKDIYEISAGYNSSSLIDKNGDMYVFGDNTNKKIGLTSNATTPTKISTLSNIEAISSGEGYHTMAMDRDGYIYETGLNDNGQLGFNDTTNRTTYTKLGETKIGLNKVLYKDRLFLNYAETEELKAKVINTINLKTDIVSEEVVYSVDDSSIMSLDGNKLNVDTYGEIKLTITNVDASLSKEIRVVTYVQFESIVQGVRDFTLPDGKQTLVIVGNENELRDYDVEMINYHDDMNYKSNASLGSTESDSRMLIVKYHKNLNIDTGVTITATTRKKGMYICVLGTTTNNGTITMTARGAVAEGENVYLWKNIDDSFEYVPAEGSAGGLGVKRTSAGVSYNAGTSGINRGTGGGGSGGAATSSTSYVPTSGSGSAGTSYSGGSGGGSVSRVTATATNAQPNGGAGGNSYTYSSTSYSATGGTGNPGGTGRVNNTVNSAYAGTTGTGGLLIMYSDEIFNNGLISSNGTNANNSQTNSSYSATGGASGGGSVNVFCNRYYRSSEIDITATGGTSSKGGSGGNGTTTLIELGQNLNYEEKELDLKVGDTYTFDKNKISYIGVSDFQTDSIPIGSIKYEVENAEIATITTDGKLVALKQGMTKVKITNLENDDVTYVYIKVANTVNAQVETGKEFTVVLKENGTVWAWGDNSRGQLGIGSTDNNLEPIRVGDNVYPNGYEGYLETTLVNESMDLSDRSLGNKIDNNITQNPNDYLQKIKSISVGYNHVLALSEDGKVYAWGAGTEGQVGNGVAEDTLVPVELGLSNIKFINAYKNMSIAIGTDNSLYIWGEGYGNVPKEINTNALGKNIVQVSGDILLTSEGKVYKITNNIVVTFDLIDEMYEIAKISAGEDHYLALNVRGNVYSFGSNTYGQLGNTSNTSGGALMINDLNDIYEIETGDKTSIFSNVYGNVYVCGQNTNGKIGASSSIVKTPEKLSSISDIVAISTASEHSIASDSEGNVFVTGLNTKGQLGFNDTTTRTTFTKLTERKIGINKLIYHEKLFINFGVSTEIKAKVINTINLKEDILIENLNYEIDNTEIMSISGNVITPNKQGEVSLKITNDDESLDKVITVVTYVEYESIVQGVKDNDLPDGNQTIIINGAENELMDYDVEYVNYYDDMLYTTNASLGNSTADERMLIVKYHGNLTINTGVKITANARKKGMFICVNKNLENNGTITMTARGAIAEGENVYLWKNIDNSFEYVPAIGGEGGKGVTLTAKGTGYNSGMAATGRATGGGGSGGSATSSTSYRPTSGSGSAGTSYSGGSGGGAACYLTGTAGSAKPNGGAGGNGVQANTTGSRSATGGTGNPGGTGKAANAINSAYAGTTGTGGLLIVYADDLYNNGMISSNGTDANNKLITTSANCAATGGASGGGSVNIFANNYYKQTTNDTSAVGGTSKKGGSGGAGAVNIVELSQYLNYEDKELELNIGETTNIELSKLSYIAQIAGEELLNVGTLSYSVADDSIATIDDLGNIVALKSGRTKVTIEDKTNSQTTYVLVNVIDRVEPEVAIGENFTIALKTNGTVWSFGKNEKGELGLGDNENRLEPTPIETLSNIVKIASGYSHTIALDRDGNIYTWGLNTDGQLGNGSTRDSNVPVLINLSTKIVKIDAYKNKTIALDENGKVYCWGEDFSSIPSVLSINKKVVDISGNLILTYDGSCYKIDDLLNAISGLKDIAKISAGEDHYLALDTNGKVYSWGANTYGQLGNTNNTSGNPIMIADLPEIYEISAGKYTTMLLDKDCNVYVCGGITSKVTTPKLEISDVEFIEAGESTHSAVVEKNGFAFVKGTNTFGELGLGDTETRSVFTQLGVRTFTSNPEEVIIGIGETVEMSAIIQNTFNLKIDVIDDSNMVYTSTRDDIITISENNITGLKYGEDTILISNTVTSESIEINVKVVLSAESIMQGVRDNELEDGNIYIKVKDEIYPIELYNYYDDVIYTSNTSLGNSTADERMLIVKYHKNLTINKGVKVTSTVRKKGMYICVLGDLINNGEISMTARGAKAEGQNVYLWKNKDNTYEYVPAEGANGGEAIKISGSAGRNYGNVGLSGTNRATGGGGAGGATMHNNGYTALAGSGSAGTSYSGGTGGGAASACSGNVTAENGNPNGGAGGRADTIKTSTSATGGTGNDGGIGELKSAVNNAYKGTNGTGGLLMIYADEIYNNGIFTSNGTNANNTLYSTSAYHAATGGASGAGSINVFCNEYYKYAEIDTQAIGGNSVRGGNGGNGSVTIMELNYLSYPEKEIELKPNETYNIDESKLSNQTTDNNNQEKLIVGTITYESLDASIATVSDIGEVVAVNEGKTKIKITDITNDTETYIYIVVTKKGIPELELGENFTIGLKTNGTVWGFGQNTNGQLGNGDSVNHQEPVQVITTTGEALNNIVDIGSGTLHSVAVSKDGKVYTWGSVKLGTTTEIIKVATQIDELENIIKVDAYKEISLAVNVDGEVFAWGDGYDSITKLDLSEKVIDVSGPLMLTEYGKVYLINTMKAVPYLNNIAKISAGEDHYLALSTSGHVYSFGDSSKGQCGNGIVGTLTNPILINTLENVYDISAGRQASMVTTIDGSIYNFGNNSYTKLGLSSTSYSAPAKVADIENAELVSAGEGDHTAILMNDGFVWTVGLNTNGQLGLGDTTTRKVYTQVGTTVLESNPNPIILTVGESIEPKISLNYTFNLKSDEADSENIETKLANSSIATYTSGIVQGKNVGRTTIYATHTITGDTKNVELRVVGAEGDIVVPKLEAGNGFTVALKANGTVWTWGINNYGGLGIGNTTVSNLPLQVEMPETIIDISVGEYHVLAVGESGTVYSFGLNSSGQLGCGNKVNQKLPVKVVDANGIVLTNIVKVVANKNVSFAIDNEGNAYSWGNGYTIRASLISGYQNVQDISSSYILCNDGIVRKLSDGTEIDIYGKVKAISEGEDNTLFLNEDNTVYAIGNNTYGQLGIGNNISSTSSVVAVRKNESEIFDNVLSISAGNKFNLITTLDRKLYSFGLNDNGQLGIENITETNLPIENEYLQNVMLIDAGYTHATVALTDGSVYVWGLGTNGQLGNGENISSNIPVEIGKKLVESNTNNLTIMEGETFDIESSISYFNILRDSTEEIKYSTKDMDIVSVDETTGLVTGLRSGKTAVMATEVGTDNIGIIQVTVLPSGTHIEPKVFTTDSHTLMLRADGTVWSFGKNTYGQLGNGTTTSQDEPMQVVFPEGIIIFDIAVGENHSLALDSEGNVWSWGRNNYYQLGNTSNSIVKVPTKVSGISNVIKIATGNNTSFAITKDKLLYAWGLNSNGECGIGSFTNKVTITKAKNITDVIDVVAGRNHTLILRSNGDVYVSGSNLYGQLGNGNKEMTKSEIFIQVKDIAHACYISAGESSNMALITNGNLYAWGSNIYGNLGLDDKENRNVPAKVEGLGRISSISVGKSHSAILQNDGTIYLTGANTEGQIGNGTTNNSSVFVGLTNIDNIMTVSCGNTYTVVAKQDGTVWAWGDYNHGDDSLKSKTNSEIPVIVGNELTGVDSLEMVIKKSEIERININAKYRFNILYVNEYSKEEFTYKSLNEDIAQVDLDGNILGVREGSTWVKAISETGKEYVVIVRVIDNTTIQRPKVSSGKDFVVTLKADGSIWSNGYNSNGELGLANNRAKDIPTSINVLSTYTDIDSGESFTIALRSDKTVWSFGKNTYGQLGNGTLSNSTKATQISNLADIELIAAGSEHVVAIDENGFLYGWGRNNKNQLGTVNAGKSTLVPTIIEILEYRPIYLSAGDTQTLIISSEGNVYGYGSILNGKLDGIEDAVKAEVYDDSLLILKSDGAVVIYKDGSIVNLLGIENVIDISTSSGSAMFQTVDEKLYVLGNNSNGKLGINSSIDTDIITEVSIDNVYTIGAGYNNTYVIKNNGLVYASGENTYGQLGNSTRISSEIYTLMGDRAFEIKPTSAIMYVNDVENISVKTKQFNVFTEKETSPEEYEWTSDMESVVSAENGTLKALSEGLANITVKDKVTGEEVVLLRSVIPIENDRIDWIKANDNEAEVSGEYEYSVDVATNGNDITVKVLSRYNTDKISIDNGITWSEGGILTQTITVEEISKDIEVLIETENGTQIPYTLHINKISKNNGIKNVIVDGNSAIPTSVSRYEAVVEEDSITNVIVVKAESATSSVSIEGMGYTLAEQTLYINMGDTLVRTIPIIIKAQNGDEADYTLVVYKKSAITNLNTVKVNGIEAMKTSDSIYTITVPIDASNLDIYAETVADIANVGINGEDIVNKKSLVSTKIVDDYLEVIIRVEAEIEIDGIVETLQKDYTLKIYRQEETLAINMLLVNGEKIEEINNTFTAFLPGTTESATVVIKAKNENDIIVFGEAKEESTGVYTTNVDITKDINTYEIIVRSEEDGAEEIYTLIIKRASLDVSLKEIEIQYNTTIKIAKKVSETEYVASIPKSVTSVDVSAYTKYSNATISINGADFERGSTSQNISIVDEETTVIITIKSENEEVVQDYTLKIVKMSDNADLKEVSVDGTLATLSTTEADTYEIQLTEAVKEVKVKATTDDTISNVRLEGYEYEKNITEQTIAIDAKQTIKKIYVKAEDGTIKMYQLIINGLPDNTNIDKVTVNGETATYIDGENRYEIKLDAENYEIEVTLEDLLATLKIADDAETVGRAISIIPKSSESPTIVEVRVTSQNGLVSTLYTIAIYEKSNNADMGSITVNGKLISPSADGTYNAKISSKVDTAIVNVISADENAMVELDGESAVNIVTVTENITNNLTTYIVKITSEDGKVEKEYTINIQKLTGNTNVLQVLVDDIDATLLDNGEYYSKIERVDTAKIKVILEDENAQVSINGGVFSYKESIIDIEDLKDSNRIKIVVLSDDEIEEDYILNIVKKSNDCEIKEVTALEEVIGNISKDETGIFTIEVDEDLDVITLTIKTNSDYAKLKLSTDTDYTESEITRVINLTEEYMEIYVDVQSESGEEKTHTIAISKIADVSIDSLKVNDELAYFDDETETYSASVNVASTAKVDIVMKKSNNNVTIKSGDTVIATGTGTLSVDVPLTDEITYYTVVLAAEKTSQELEYTLVIRMKSTNTEVSYVKVENESATLLEDGTYYAQVSRKDEYLLEVRAKDENAQVKIEDGEYSSEVASQKIPVADGETKAVIVTIKSENGDEKQYTVNIERISNNTKLLSVVVNGTEVSYNALTDSYEIILPRDVMNTDIVATAERVDATVSIDSSEDINILTINTELPEEGVTTFEIEVTAANGDTESYELKIIKLSNNTKISTISVDGKEATIGEDEKYYVKIDNQKSPVIVIATSDDENASIDINKTGSSNLSSQNYNLDIPSRGDIEIPILVTAEDGETTKEYVLVVNVKEHNLNVQSVKVNSEDVTFNGKKYIAYILSTVNEVNVDITSESEYSTITFNGETALEVSKDINILDETTVLKFIVTAEDGCTKEYEINIIRLSDNTNMGKITVDGKEATLREDGKYYVQIDDLKSMVNVVAKAEDTRASVEINNNGTSSKSSQTYELLINGRGEVIVPIKVTSEDGVFDKEYTLIVDVKEHNINLISFKVNGVELVSKSGKFSTFIDSTATSVDIDIIVESDYTLITLDDVEQFKELSKNITTSEEVTSFEFTITAEDGCSKKYEVELTKISTDNTVGEIYVDGKQILPDASGNYVAKVYDTKSSVIVKAVTNNQYATVRIGTGIEQSKTVTETVDIEGRVTTVDIIVKSQSNVSKVTTLTLEQVSTNNQLETVLVDSKEVTNYDSSTRTYIASVDYDKEQVEIFVMAESSYATISVNGVSEKGSITTLVNLSEDEKETEIPVIITSEAGVDKTYTIRVIKKSNDTSLGYVKVNGITRLPSEDGNYRVAIAYLAESVNIEIQSNDKLAQIRIADDLSMQTYIAKSNVKLDSNSPEISVPVNITASDGKTVKTYNIILSRESNDASIESLTVNDDEVTLEENIYRYEIDSSADTAIVKIKATDANAQITFGTNVAISSLEVSVNTSVTTYEFSILSEDGTVENKYTLILERVVFASGTVTTQNASGIHNAIINVYETEDSGERTFVKSITTNDDGSYKVSLAFGKTYELSFEKQSYLSYEIVNVEAIEGDTISFETIELFAGDVVITGEIEIDDLVKLNDNIGTVITDENRADKSIYDLNEDGIVDAKDRNILKANYSKTSEIIEWVNPHAIDVISMMTTFSLSPEAEEIVEKEEFILPITCDYIITDDYGYRIHPVTGEESFHSGVDLAGSWHTEILSVADGEVTFAGVQSGYGNCIEIKHEINGETIYSFYAHLSQIDVTLGDTVSQGDIIGLEGGDPDIDPNPGLSTGHHLHFELRNLSGYGNCINPHDYLGI